MSKFSKFMKANKAVKENATHIVTKSLCDENGKPLEWEFRHITSKENEEIRESCTIEVPITGKPNVYRQKFKTSLYIQRMIVASIASPDLYDAELQDSITTLQLMYRSFRALIQLLRIRWTKQKTDRRRGLGSELCLLCPS